jgi:hypothetical protein
MVASLSIRCYEFAVSPNCKYSDILNIIIVFSRSRPILHAEKGLCNLTSYPRESAFDSPLSIVWIAYCHAV